MLVVLIEGIQKGSKREANKEPSVKLTFVYATMSTTLSSFESFFEKRKYLLSLLHRICLFQSSNPTLFNERILKYVAMRLLAIKYDMSIYFSLIMN